MKRDRYLHAAFQWKLSTSIWLTYGVAIGLIAFTFLGSPSALGDDDAEFPGMGGDSANRIHDTRYRSDVVDITVNPGEQLEYVVDLEQGESLLYSWQVDKGNLYTDFHSEPSSVDDYPKDYWIRYEESEDGSAHGAVVAPFTGHTAWFWRNKNEHSITVRLELAGYFSNGRISGRKKIPSD